MESGTQYTDIILLLWHETSVVFRCFQSTMNVFFDWVFDYKTDSVPLTPHKLDEIILRLQKLTQKQQKLFFFF